jgi:hypothetical protein
MVTVIELVMGAAKNIFLQQLSHLQLSRLLHASAGVESTNRPLHHHITTVLVGLCQKNA